MTDITVGRTPYWLDTSSNCGAMCIHFMDRYFGGNTDFREIAMACPPRLNGLHLAELKEQLDLLGYDTCGFKGSIGALTRAKYPLILRYDLKNQIQRARRRSRDHFVVIVGWDTHAKRFLVFDPPSHYYKATRREIASASSGIGLLVNDSPIDLEESFDPKPAWGFTIGGGVLVGLGLTRVWRHRQSVIAVAKSLRVALMLLPLLMGCGKRAVDTNPHEFDRGVVPAGAKVSHVFQVYNQSEEPLTFLSIKGDCSCSKSFLEKLPITVGPGEFAEAQVEWEVGNADGDKVRKFVVTTDAEDPLHKTIVLRLTAEVMTLVRVIPKQLHFGIVRRDETHVEKVQVHFRDKEMSGMVERLETSSNSLTAKTLSVEPNWLTLEVRLTQDKPSGPLFENLTLRFADKNIEDIIIPVTGEIRGDLKLTPVRLYIHKPRFGNSHLSARMRVQSVTGRQFVVSRIDAPAGMSAKVEQPSRDETHYIHVLFDDFEKAREAKSLTLHTDHPQYRELVIPVEDLNQG